MNSYIYENYCLKCSNKIYYICSFCRIDLIYKGLKIFKEEKTLEEIIYNNKSISRFGDGEFSYILGNNISFQLFNQNLSKKLLKVFNSNEKGLLIAINFPYEFNYLKKFKLFAKNYYKFWLKLNKLKLIKLLDKKKQYYSARITRFYMDYKNHLGISHYIEKLKLIWDQKDVAIIEGEKSRLGVGNDLFDNMKSIKRIICPVENAFDKYELIINAIERKIDRNILILIALGPTATVLAYDLYKKGYQALDVGHIDIEYEWYLRKAKNKIKIENKFVSEVDNGINNYTYVEDKNYYNQIIEKIS